ncbi:MAG: hypothetical protein O9248_01645, partial [Rhodobacteraceae bacterium]|nr:hypothetical protein [Paracoccaceae bacterium]
ENGEIVIDGGENGIVSVNGLVNASGNGADARGGNVTVLGEKVGLFESARVDVSGAAGGGQALIGGNYQGKGPEANAKMVYMDARAVIDASATANGDGGRVILWSDLYTSFQGNIAARGGALGGNGGFVETSSKDNLQVQTGRVDVGAAMGRSGTWLLDPRNVTIANATVGGTLAANVFHPTADSATIDVAAITAALNVGTSVEITTGAAGAQAGNITVGTAIAKTAGGNAVLTLNAAGAIYVYNAISSTAGQLGLNLWSGTNIEVTAAVTTNNGAITTAGTNGVGAAGGYFNNIAAINTGTANITLNHTGNIALDNGVNTSGIVTLSTTASISQNVAITGSGSLVLGGTGPVTLLNSGNAFSSITLNRAAATSNVSLRTSITPNVQTSSIGTGQFTLTGQGFTQSGAITQAAGGGTVTIAGGTGTVTLSQANAWTGAVTVTGSAIEVTGPQTATGGGSFVFDATNRVAISSNILASGDISIWGNAPNGNPSMGVNTVGDHDGVKVNAGVLVDAGGGNIDIAGRGGNSLSNYGVRLLGGHVLTSGNGSISIKGQGGSSATGGSLIGVGLISEAYVKTQHGALVINGVGSPGTSGGYNSGIFVYDSRIEATGNGSIALTGLGGASSTSESIYFAGSEIVGAGNGSIVLTAPLPSGGGTALAFVSGGPTNAVEIGGVAFQGDVELRADTIANSASSLSISRVVGGGTITLRPNNNSTSIGLNGGSGSLSIAGTILSSIQGFSVLQLGSGAQTGDIQIDSTSFSQDLKIWTQGSSLTNSLSLGSRDLTIIADAGYTQGAGAITTTGTVTFGGSGSVVANSTTNMIGTLVLEKAASTAAVSIVNSTAIDLGTSTMGTGVLTLSAPAITQSGALTQSVGGGSVILNAGSGGVTFTNSSNVLRGAVSLTTTGYGNAAITNSAGVAIQLGASSVTGNLAVTSGGAITQSDALMVGGASQFTSAAAIDLTGSAVNEFSGPVSLSNSGVYDILINAKNNLTIGGVSTTGSFSAMTAGGTLSLSTANSFAPSKDVTLVATGNVAGINITASQSLSGGNLSIASDRHVSIAGATIDTGGGDIVVSANSTGAALGGSPFSGVVVDNAIVQSRGGHITITGKGPAAIGGSYSHGVVLRNGGVIRSFTTLGDGEVGVVNLNGTGGGASGGTNVGVYVAGSGSGIFSKNGAITITAQGGSDGSNNTAFSIEGGTIRTEGSGSVEITALGGPSHDSRGAVVTSGGILETTGTGSITLVGSGGPTGSKNYGVHVFDFGFGAGVIRATGTGAVTITGTGGASGLENHGVLITSIGSQVSSLSGALTITGTGGGMGTDADGTGVSVLSGGLVKAQGLGGATIIGTGGNGSGTGNHGVVLSNSNVESTGSGSILLTGMAGVGTGPLGLSFAGASVTVGGATHTGNTTLRADSISSTATSLALSRQTGGGMVTIQPDTNITQVHVGTSGTGLQIDGTVLSAISGFAAQKFGSATQTGAINLAGITLLRDTTVAVNSAGVYLASDGNPLALNGRTLTVSSITGNVVQSGGITGAGTL